MGNAPSCRGGCHSEYEPIESTLGVSQAYMKSSAEPNFVLSFDPSQRKLINSVWSHAMANTDRDVAVEIFNKILKKSARIRDVFNLEPGPEPSPVKYGRFVSHAAIVKNALDFFIKLWVHDDPKIWLQIPFRIRSLGARHFPVPNEKFSPDLWNMFADGLIEVTETWKIPCSQKHEFDRCWREMTYFILANMKIGYKNAVLMSERAENDPKPPQKSQILDQEEASDAGGLEKDFLELSLKI